MTKQSTKARRVKIKAELFRTSFFMSNSNCALAQTAKRLHPGHHVMVGDTDIDVHYANQVKFSYDISSADLEKVVEAYENPRDIFVTLHPAKARVY